MARQLDIAVVVVPQGAPIVGPQAIAELFDWLENLVCGIDLFDYGAYQLPTANIDLIMRTLTPA